jgi:twitching motility protein PilT
MINYINERRRAHIITIEDPIEYVHASKNCLVHQRELHRDVPSFSDALRSAMREDPDVILVGEMRDYETISAAVTAAETGHLVFSTLHTTGAAQTLDRIVDVYPSHSQGMIKSQLSGVLRGVITQTLVPRADSSGRVAATEILIGTDAVLNLIREGKYHQLGSTMQSGAASGMHTLAANLADLVRKGIITEAAARERVNNRAELEQYLGF